MTVVVLGLAAAVAVYVFTAAWLYYRFRRKFPLCGFVLPPPLLKRIEERLQSEGKPVPRWVTEGMKRRCRT